MSATLTYRAANALRNADLFLKTRQEIRTLPPCAHPCKSARQRIDGAHVQVWLHCDDCERALEHLERLSATADAAWIAREPALLGIRTS